MSAQMIAIVILAGIGAIGAGLMLRKIFDAMDRAQQFRALAEDEHAEFAEHPLTDSYVHKVPDKCDRIVWRNQYIHLPIAKDEYAEIVKAWMDDMDDKPAKILQSPIEMVKESDNAPR